MKSFIIVVLYGCMIKKTNRYGKGKTLFGTGYIGSNSSDMQLAGNFYHITEPELLAKFQGTALVRKRLLPLHKLSFCGSA